VEKARHKGENVELQEGKAERKDAGRARDLVKSPFALIAAASSAVKSCVKLRMHENMMTILVNAAAGSMSRSTFFGVYTQGQRRGVGIGLVA